MYVGQGKASQFKATDLSHFCSSLSEEEETVQQYQYLEV